MSVQQCYRHDYIYESHMECPYCAANATAPETITIPIAEYEAMRLDAERYAWLRDKAQWYECHITGETSLLSKFKEPSLDEAIDAAIKEGN